MTGDITVSTERLERAFDLLTTKYVQRADDRQKDMGLQYTTAETHDLAAVMSRFAEQEIATAPGEAGWDFIRVFESWGESEANLTAVMIDLAIAATMIKLGAASVDGTGELTITTAELRELSETYEVKREQTATGWTIKLSRYDAETISAKG